MAGRAPARTVLLDFLAVTGAGQETRTRAFAAHVRRFDPDSRFVVLKEIGRLDDVNWEAIGASVVDAPRFTGALAGARRMAWELRHLPRLLRANDASVYLTFSHYLPPTVRCAQRIVGVSNLAPFSKDAWRLASPAGKLRLSLLRRSIVSSARRATSVLALSRTCRRMLEERGVSPGRIVVVSNGADGLEEGSTAPNRGEGEAPIVLCVSHFYAYKNYETLLRAFALLPPALLRTHELLLVGPPIDAAYYRRVVALAETLRGACRIRIVPGVPRADLAALYASCAAFVFPSLIENSPNVLLEAMSQGVPCIVSRADPMPEYGGDAVVYFDPLSAQQLSAALVEVLGSASRRRELSEAARRTVRRYRWEDLVRTTVEQYRGSAGAAPRSPAELH